MMTRAGAQDPPNANPTPQGAMKKNADYLSVDQRAMETSLRDAPNNMNVESAESIPVIGATETWIPRLASQPVTNFEVK